MIWISDFKFSQISHELQVTHTNHSHALQGQYKNVMTGLEFDSAEPGEPQLKGEMILKTTFGISLDHSKWWDVAVLLFQLFVYKVLLFLVLRYNKRIAPQLRLSSQVLFKKCLDR